MYDRSFAKMEPVVTRLLFVDNLFHERGKKEARENFLVVFRSTIKRTVGDLFTEDELNDFIQQLANVDSDHRTQINVILREMDYLHHKRCRIREEIEG